MRPFGALVFGRLGDLVGRKYTFLVTMTLMGIGTFLIGVLPTYASIGIAAPILLIVLRLVQGLALGGEYGGAATYVAEHAPNGKRGLYTSWIQTTATLGLFMALLVILGIRTAMGEAAFDEWGWRIPFLLSVVLLGVSIWIRLQLAESPAFQKMKDEGKQSKAPLKEAFGNWANGKIAILALLGATAGEAVVWYGGQFYALFFLTQTIKVPAVNAQIMIVIALALATPGFIFFGWLSDKIGRKPIMMAGFLLAVVTYFPLFQGITHFANPALEKALAESPVTVVADPAQCSFQLKLTGTEQYTKPCDVAKSTLVARSVNYNNETAAAGAPVVVKVGSDSYTAGTPDFVKNLNEAITKHGYPASADTNQINYPMTVLLLTILVDLRDDGVRPDRRVAGRAVPDPHPLHRHVAALSHRQWLVRRLPARDRVRDRGGDRKHLLRPLVSDHHRGDELHRRADLPARDEGSRHQPHLTLRRHAPGGRRHVPPALSFAASDGGCACWRGPRSG